MAESTELDNIEEKLQAFLTKECPSIMEQGMVPHVYANDKNNTVPFGILDMFYQGVFTNTLGVMIAKHRTSGIEVPILVGRLGSGENADIMPLAIVMGADQAQEFLPPDGEGDYIRYPVTSETDGD